MASVPRSVRLPEQLDARLARVFRRRGIKEWSEGAVAVLDEAVRMLEVPGIVFVGRQGSRRAAVAFSGLEVWELIATFREAREDWTTFRQAYPELSEAQLRAALAYYKLYPDEIDARLALEAEWTPERVAAELPATQATTLEL